MAFRFCPREFVVLSHNSIPLFVERDWMDWDNAMRWWITHYWENHSKLDLRVEPYKSPLQLSEIVLSVFVPSDLKWWWMENDLPFSLCRSSCNAINHFLSCSIVSLVHIFRGYGEIMWHHHITDNGGRYWYSGTHSQSHHSKQVH